MNVSEAVAARSSIRAFLDTPVSDELLRELLSKSARAPSGGNVQPWRLFVLNGDRTRELVEHVQAWNAAGKPNTPPYRIYPEGLSEPYRSSRFKVGEDMYALLGIPREDKPARLRHLARNMRFFDAPAAFFCYVDRQMGPPQWSDLGMFLQTFMLLAQEAGLSTCAQEAWCNQADAVAEFVQPPDELMLFCGMAIGYADPDAPVNTLRSDREPLEVFARFV